MEGKEFDKKNHYSLSCIPMREQKWVVLFFLQVRLWRCTLMENLLSGLSGYCRDLWLISGSRSSKPTENYFFVEESNLLMDMVSVGLDWGYITSCWVTNIRVTGRIVSSCVGSSMQVNAASQAGKLYWPALCMRADLLSGWVNNSTLCQL